MKYPKLKPQKDRRKKLKPKDIAYLKALKASKYPNTYIAFKLGVSLSAVEYWTNEHTRMIRLETSKAYIKKLQLDPKYRKKKNKRMQNYIINRSREDKEFRNWRAEISRNYYWRKKKKNI